MSKAEKRHQKALKLIDNTLEVYTNGEGKENPWDGLDIIAEMCLMTEGAKFYESKKLSTFKLCSNQSGKLRSLALQCLYGGAPEILRDKALTCLLVIWNHSDILDDSWTIEEDNPKGNFSNAICKVLSVEIHLALQEALSVSTELSSGKTITTNSEPMSEKAMENYLIRRKRLDVMLPVCFSLLSSVLRLLVGSNGSAEEHAIGDDDVDETFQEGAWSQLSYDAVESIRETTQTTLSEIIDFVKAVTTSTSCTTLDKWLSKVVRMSLSVVSSWAEQDADLIQPFLELLPYLFQYEQLSTNIPNESTQPSFEINYDANVLTLEDCFKRSIDTLGSNFNFDSSGDDIYNLFSDSSNLKIYIEQLSRKNSFNRNFIVELLPPLVNITSTLEEIISNSEIKEKSERKSKNNERDIKSICDTVAANAVVVNKILALTNILALSVRYIYESLTPDRSSELIRPGELHMAIHEIHLSLSSCLHLISFIIKCNKFELSEVVAMVNSSTMSEAYLGEAHQYFGAKATLDEAFRCVYPFAGVKFVETMELVRLTFIIVRHADQSTQTTNSVRSLIVTMSDLFSLLEYLFAV